ncbi:MAG: aminoacyl-tRNA hydrolase [Clostridia bacterium]|nr:aminoacyl-tRNA hydrolase [Clostridia bacterium]
MLVGLGNPGLNYEKTRHNAGFMAVDKFCKTHGITQFKNKFNALVADATINGNRILVVKPQTYMNNSGEAVGKLAKFYKIAPENVLVMFDDISFPVGVLRIRRKGSAGGHNGIKSIIAHLGSENFPRIKIGVGDKPHADADLKNHVLSNFGAEDLKNLDAPLERCVLAAELIINDQTDKAMNMYNG